MKRKIFLYTLLAIAALFVVRGIYYMVCNATYEPQDGDVIFHVSESNQSKAIKIGTLSRYSHCGIVVIENGQPYVNTEHLFDFSQKFIETDFTGLLRKPLVSVVVLCRTYCKMQMV